MRLNKNKIFGLFGIFITIGLMTYLVVYLDVKSIINALTTSDFTIVLLVFFLSFLNLFIQFKKWGLVCRYQLDIRVPKTILYSLFYGISAGAFTPVRVGEYIARAVPMKEKSVMAVSMATFIDKIIPVLIAVSTGSVLFAYYLLSKGLIGYIPVVLVLSIVIIVLVAGILLSRKLELIGKLRKYKYINKIVDQLLVLKEVKGKYLLPLIILSLLYHLTFTSQMALLICAVSRQSDFFTFLYMANLIVFVQFILPAVTLGDLGIREGAAVYFAKAIGIEPVFGFNAAILLFFINIILPSIYGLFFIAHKNK